MNMKTTMIMIVAVQNHSEGDANHLILDAHAISPPPPQELSPPSIIPTTEETYKGQQEEEDNKKGIKMHMMVDHFHQNHQ